MYAIASKFALSKGSEEITDSAADSVSLVDMGVVGDVDISISIEQRYVIISLSQSTPVRLCVNDPSSEWERKESVENGLWVSIYLYQLAAVSLPMAYIGLRIGDRDGIFSLEFNSDFFWNCIKGYRYGILR